MVSRRNMLRGGAAAGAALGVGGFTMGQAAAQNPGAPAPPRRNPSMMGVPFEARETARIGVIGLGNRGSSMLADFLQVPGTRVTALCDVDPKRVTEGVRAVRAAGQPKPSTYSGDERAFEQLCTDADVDLIYIATPWQWHTEMALTGMRGDKHVGVECTIAQTEEDLWKLVDESERSRKHCIQLENCCYGQNEMRALRMAHAGKFGTLLHTSGAYLHDLREEMFSDTYYADQWRRAWHTKLNGDLYPTHGLGPACSYLDVHRGDRLLRITSMSTPAAGLAEYRKKNVPSDDPAWQESYTNGDATFSLIQTERGRVIHLRHDVTNPQPYSRLNQLAGTNGVFEDYPSRIYLESDMDEEEWGNFDDYAEFDHWLWTDVGPGSGGHGGMDYIMLYRLVQTMRLGIAPDIDVYDSATWSAAFALSNRSVERGGAPVDFPDFTRGNWEQPHPGIDSAKPGR